VTSIILGIGSASGDIGQAISHILYSNDSIVQAVAFDKSPRHNTRFKQINKSPGFQSQSFGSWLRLFLLANEVTHYVPCSEPEMRYLPTYLPLVDMVKVIWAGQQIFELFDNKSTGSQYLEDNGFYVPKQYGIDILEQEFSTPVVVKPRRSSGSRSVHVCTSRPQLVAAVSNTNEPIIQQFIPYNNNEFTVGVHRTSAGDTKTIVLLRNLEEGRTKSALVVKDEFMSSECVRLADLLKLDGSINVQIRKFDGTNYIFEVNPRFSSTLQGRHLLGFRDFMWSVGLEPQMSQNEIDKSVGISISRNSLGKFEISGR